MKVKDWKEMLNKLNDEDNLCIARVISDFGGVRIDFIEPNIDKRKDIHPSFIVKEFDNDKNEKCDYIVY